MQCPRCGFVNPEGMKFCGECGTSIKNLCQQCGFENRSKLEFCGECGTSLVISFKPKLDPSTEQTPEPSSYTPQYLAEKILTSRSTLQGERKQVTVMFADIKDWTELIRCLAEVGA